MRTWPAYRTLWIWLLLGWTVSAADRALTGPVVTWMIDNKVGFLAHADKPYALGGLIGGLFFAGYMLTQFPGGYLGDKYGHRTIIVLSLDLGGHRHAADRRDHRPRGVHRHPRADRAGRGRVLLQRPLA